MANHKILIVEDDKDISEMIRYNLEKDGYSTVSVFDGEKVSQVVKASKPDLIILDIMLPGMDGLEICKNLKRDQSAEDIPIIMLTAKSQESDKIVGLELGADDYVTKPFSPKELIARIKAVLRRQKPAVKIKEIKIGDLAINQLKHKVTVQAREVALTASEFKLLSLLAGRPGIVISREEILNQVFGYDSSSYDRTVDTHIKSLRKKIGDVKSCIETVRGVGYRFKDEP
ncbi:MAG: response regulator transcription factor [Candidatus Omnitrophica bacterium]|nr:response regulator transcription factor [Candidatus Omnitrophota bacterium]MBU1997098.1 response regulator transcription factor [Candidatus Omnitrophota bacterium]